MFLPAGFFLDAMIPHTGLLGCAGSFPHSGPGLGQVDVEGDRWRKFCRRFVFIPSLVEQSSLTSSGAGGAVTDGQFGEPRHRRRSGLD